MDQSGVWWLDHSPEAASGAFGGVKLELGLASAESTVMDNTGRIATMTAMALNDRFYTGPVAYRMG
jgi:hypothetical protein